MQLAWDPQTLLEQSARHEQTAEGWAALMNERCANFAVVLLEAAAINFDYAR